ncbi:hypothetical protein RN001_009370 [Aquatica leii]|uniref:Zinc finger PHD-type domain-containing protein n=1 Tax=Aquatica leii TaxID=1421715 RepID=A0AAN7P4J3_9COLE|nr:hypothetical protein RN001_009370 [Aquatica leii]
MENTDSEIPFKSFYARSTTPVPSTLNGRLSTPIPSVSTDLRAELVSPIQMLPLPKKKSVALRKSKGKKSIILTSTPVKEELENAIKAKNENTKSNGKRNTSAKNKIKKTSFKKKQILEASEENVTCPACEESFFATLNDDWVQCNKCKNWWHDDCSSYEEVGQFICDYCV